MSLQRVPTQIVRESVPAVDPAAPRTTRSWEWVCSSLVNKDRGDCALEILDTVFVQREQIWSWFYSSRGGVIRRKAQRKLTATDVVQRLTTVAGGYEQNAADYVALCWFEDQRRLQFLTAPECHTYLANCKGPACLSAFAHPRGELDTTRYANLEHEYSLHKSGRLQSKLYRHALGNQRILSMDSKLNNAVGDMVQTIVSYVERAKRCRVVDCTSHFVIDDFGRVMLWRTDNFHTIALPNSSVASDLSGGPTYQGPHAVNERVLARALADASKKPNDKLIQAILSSPTPVSRRHTMLLQSSSSQPSLPSASSVVREFNFFSDDNGLNRRSTQRSQLRNKSDWDEAMQFLPTSSSLSRGRKRTLSAAHLISSQKKGCCGDFCDTDVRKWTSKRLGARPPVLPIASPLVDIANNGLARRGIGGRSSSVISATTAASAFLIAHPDNTLDESLLRKPMSPQRQQMEGSCGEMNTKPHTIPFKLIAQTRAEKQLVDLFIRRYQNGEDGDYLAEMYYGEGEPLGQTFPGYYYQEVQVCANCFAFYTLVEGVRMKALRQLEMRRLSNKTNAEDRKRVNWHGASRGLEALHEERDDAESDTAQLERLELTATARRLYKQAWILAHTRLAPAISKQDAAELFSFVNPHPAITMVVEALGIMLLGRDDIAPAEVRRTISQDKLLTQLQNFDLERLPHARVDKVAAHIRNPLFTPDHIGPISSCAGRFCDWILTVLQAYAWRNYRSFQQDPATWEMFAFLKRELAGSKISREMFVEGFFRSHTVMPVESMPAKNETPEVGSATKKKVAAAAVARRAIQNQQMTRLSAPSGVVEATTLGGNEAIFVCADGVTKIPYALSGQAVGGSTKCNLIVFNDLFDTMESTKVFFRPIVAKHVGARVLFFNLPGQAGSQYPVSEIGDQNRVVFNNVWCAHRVHELLEYLQVTGKFITTGLPFHVVGFGNGANIATSFAIHYGKHGSYVDDFQSLVLLNGFARVDAQLAGILHSTVNVFSCFPPNRPDLPVTFFCKYLFSEAYLSKVELNLALSIYTAVTNPITLDGRIRICQGALHHVDLTSELPRISVPLVLVQSVENLLVAPTSVDPFLQQRVNIAHSWSHQQQVQASGSVSDALPTKTKRQLQQILTTPGSAFVSWLRAGHELRQEAKHYVTQLLEVIVCSKEVTSDGTIKDKFDHRRREEQPLSPTKNPSISSDPETGIAPTVISGQHQSPLLAASTTTASKKQLKDVQHRASHGEKAVVATCEMNHEDATRLADTSSTAIRVEEPAPHIKEIHVFETEAVQGPSSHSPGGVLKSIQTVLSTTSCSPAVSSINADQSPVLRDPKPARLVEFGKVTRPVIDDQYKDNVSKPEEETQKAYHEIIDAEIDAVRTRMQEEERRLQKEADELRDRQRIATEERMDALRQEQERRRRQWEEEDNARLAALEKKLREEQQARVEATRQREQEEFEADLDVVSSVRHGPEILKGDLSSPVVVHNVAANLVVSGVQAMEQTIRAQPELPSMFDQMEAEEKARKRIGNLRVDDFDAIKKSMTQNFNHHVREHESSLKQELLRRKQGHAIRIQSQIRRFLAVMRVASIRQEQQHTRIRRFAGGEIVRIVRGFLGRRRFVRHRTKVTREAQERGSAIAIQRLFRGFVCRVKFRRLLRSKKAIVLQRVYRGHRGRMFCVELRESLSQRQFQDRNAAKIQATWRMHGARHVFLTQRVSILAANEIQRMYRGHLGRLEAKRKKAWRDAEPGPERLALGLKMIEGSKQTFERQQNEIDALHRAQEAVERQVSTIHAELQDSEKELAVLERELQEIDQLEADLRELTHEAEILHNGGLEGILRSTTTVAGAQKAAQPLGSGVPPRAQSGSTGFPSYEKGIEDLFEGRSDMKKRQADAYAVEMAIQIKRAEREKKKKDLEAEFTSVFAEVQQKRQLLNEMEEKLADMEATRMRKDREFARMQRNLMELLEEQKLELENLREKGIELETATATSAAAAAATAMKAKEHEKRSQAMFESTEELMKFQFMSMSLSYFSSLNMLKNLRDINADTTAAAITSTAETAAAAAAAAAAANIPTMKRLQVGGSDLMMAASQLKKHELEKKLKEEEDIKNSNQQPLPDQVKEWTVDDVGRWLDSLSLSMYKKAFCEGAVDGEFLLELRPEDMSDVLGVSHKLHVRKIIVARNKLLPISQQEQLMIDAVEHEEQARNARQGPGSSNTSASLDLDTVFSQARNGRMKRLVESVDAGFDINAEDEKGNTLLLIACQNVNIKMVEYLVSKRANVNHKNAQGNTPLHFAMAYDTDGKLGEYLIAHGADDTIENSFGLTAYDGLQPE